MNRCPRPVPRPAHVPVRPAAQLPTTTVMRVLNPGDPTSRSIEARLAATADYMVLERGRDRLLVAGCNLPLQGRDLGMPVRIGKDSATIIALEDKALLPEFEASRLGRWLGNPLANAATGGAAAGGAVLGAKLGSLVGKGGVAGVVVAAGAALATKIFLTRRSEKAAHAEVAVRDGACRAAVRDASLDTPALPLPSRR